jgi:hypothetical protein
MPASAQPAAIAAYSVRFWSSVRPGNMRTSAQAAGRAVPSGRAAASHRVTRHEQTPATSGMAATTRARTVPAMRLTPASSRPQQSMLIDGMSPPRGAARRRPGLSIYD